MTTKGLYHYPAKIINTSIAIEIAQFSASAADGFNSTSTAAVINEIDGRQQVHLLDVAKKHQLTSPDGIFHPIQRAMVLGIQFPSTCVGSLGYKRAMWVI